MMAAPSPLVPRTSSFVPFPVRVAGYPDYFVDVGRGLQDEIIARTDHETI